MAIFAKRTAQRPKALAEDVIHNLSRQIALLRSEISALSDNVADYGGDTLGDVQQHARVLAKEVRNGTRLVARQVSRQARSATRSVQENPVPALVALGTVALLSALFFTRD